MIKTVSHEPYYSSAVFETGRLTEEGLPEHVVYEPEGLKNRITCWWDDESSLDNLQFAYNPDEPSMLHEFEQDGEVLFPLWALWSNGGKQYNPHGPTDIQGSPYGINIEYRYGSHTLDLAVYVLHERGVITPQEKSDGLDIYQELPKHSQDLDFIKSCFANAPHSFASDIGVIYSWIDRLKE